MDDPAADYAVLPTFKLARTAHDDGYKVIMSGEGGDELFGGYGRYRRAARWRLLGGRPMRRRGMFDAVDVLREQPADWRVGTTASERRESEPGRTAFQVAQAVDCADWLPHDLLIKLDRCLMANGVEGRTPFLDPEVAAFAFGLPDGLKSRKGLGKWILRKWLEKKLPQAAPFTRKRGFTVPVAEWIARRGRQLGPLVARQPGIAELCRPSAVETLYDHATGRNGQAAWNLLFYALWHRRHILGVLPEGDVFAALSAR